MRQMLDGSRLRRTAYLVSAGAPMAVPSRGYCTLDRCGRGVNSPGSSSLSAILTAPVQYRARVVFVDDACPKVPPRAVWLFIQGRRRSLGYGHRGVGLARGFGRARVCNRDGNANCSKAREYDAARRWTVVVTDERPFEGSAIRHSESNHYFCSDECLETAQLIRFNRAS